MVFPEKAQNDNFLSAMHYDTWWHLHRTNIARPLIIVSNSQFQYPNAAFSFVQ